MRLSGWRARAPHKDCDLAPGPVGRRGGAPDARRRLRTPNAGSPGATIPASGTSSSRRRPAGWSSSTSGSTSRARVRAPAARSSAGTGSSSASSGVEIQGGHRLVAFQVESQVLNGVDVVADDIAAFAQALFAAVDGRPVPASRAGRIPAREGTGGRQGTTAAKAAEPARPAAKPATAQGRRRQAGRTGRPEGIDPLIEGVIFDLDGVLVDSEIWWDEVRATFAASHGRTWTVDDRAAVMGANSAAWARIMRERLDLDLPEPEIERAIVDGVVERYRREGAPADRWRRRGRPPDRGRPAGRRRLVGACRGHRRRARGDRPGRHLRGRRLVR